jgi:methyl-accepting chemotaxis protein
MKRQQQTAKVLGLGRRLASAAGRLGAHAATAVSCLKVGQRLSLGFALVLLGLFAVLAVALRNQGFSDQRLQEIVSVHLANIELASSLLNAQFDEQTEVAGMLSPDDYAMYANQLYVSQQRADASWKQLADIMQGADAPEYAAMMQARQQWRDDAIALQQQLNGGERFSLSDVQQTTLSSSKNYLEGIWDFMAAERQKIDDLAADIATLEAAAARQQIGVSALALVASLLLAWGITRSITVPLRSAVQLSRAVTDGKLDHAISPRGRDELADLLGSLARMQTQLRSRIEADRAQLAATTRITTALDHAGISLLLTDAAGRVHYHNNAARSLFETIGSSVGTNDAGSSQAVTEGTAIATVLGDAVWAELQGCAQHAQRRVMIGAHTLGLVVNRVSDDAGETLGFVLEWVDHSSEVALQQELAEVVGAVADGDFTRTLSLDGKSGFFAELAGLLNRLTRTISDMLGDIDGVLGALAEGDLTRIVAAGYNGTFGELKHHANRTVEQLSGLLSEIHHTARQLDTAAREITAGNRDLSARTEQQAASLEETASSMDELTAAVRQNAENARQANRCALDASEVARKGGVVMGEVVRMMQDISTSSGKISDIIGVIDSIAFQTNILALNAAVEAARAGEQGRGFAVVASEVRSLAQRSAAAAREIAGLISQSANKVGAGSQLVQQAGKTMGEIVGSIKRVTDIMADISAASEEQSIGIEQVNRAITQMDEVTQQNAALVEQASASAHALEDQAAGLVGHVQRFQLNAQYLREEADIAPVACPATAPKAA